MRVQAASGTWVVPPNRALWVPAGIEHEIRAIGGVQMRTLYVQPNDSQSLLGRNECAVVAATPLLRELILRLIDIQNTARGRVGEEHVAALVLDEIEVLEVQPLHVPLPAELPLRRLCEEFQSDPGSQRTSAEWSSRHGMSAKTMERAFLKTVGMTFGQWKQQVRLLAGLERLAGGEPITAVAMDLGYKSPSAFTSMFRKALGSAPSKYFG